MHTCRFCKNDMETRHRMVKYAARHWAHYDCWLDAKGAEIHDPHIYQGIMQLLEFGLHGWQLRQFPVFKLAAWLKEHKTQFPKVAGKSWADKACWIIKSTLALSEDGPTEEARADVKRMLS